MLAALGIGVFFLAHVIALVMIPLGLPGTFLQVGAAAAMAILSDGTRMSWTWVVVFALLALVGEIVEYASGQWGTRRFGGSRAAGWGALAGGIAGAFVGGIPLPIVGSLLMSFVGTFVGAIAGEMWQRGQLAPDLRVGTGALVGRVVGVGTKLCIAFVILIMSGAVVLTQLASSAAAGAALGDARLRPAAARAAGVRADHQGPARRAADLQRLARAGAHVGRQDVVDAARQRRHEAGDAGAVRLVAMEMDQLRFLDVDELDVALIRDDHEVGIARARDVPADRRIRRREPLHHVDAEVAPVQQDAVIARVG
jgi:uncharacterized protein YqgC (DUF456 family)